MELTDIDILAHQTNRVSPSNCERLQVSIPVINAQGLASEFDPLIDWQHYVARLELYFDAYVEKDKRKTIFLSVYGKKIYALLLNLSQQLVKTLTDHFDPKPSMIVQRFKFHFKSRQAGQSVSAFVADLRRATDFCNFGPAKDDMIRDRLVCGINDDRIQRRLISESDLPLKKAVDIAIAMDTAARDAVELQQSVAEPEVHNVQSSESENISSQSPVCHAEQNPTESLDSDCNESEDIPSLLLDCYAEPNPTEPLDSDCNHGDQPNPTEPLDSDCNHGDQPNPTEPLDSDCNHGDQSTLQTPSKMCSVKLEDCINVLGPKGKVILKKEEEEEEEEEEGSDFIPARGSSKPCSADGNSSSASEELTEEQINPIARCYHCSQCGKRFTRSGALKKHQTTHTGEGPYICTQCGDSFSQLQALKIHQKKHQSRHAGEKRYQCTQCEKRFTLSSTLKNHQQMHTGERPYLCSDCGRSFSRSQDLKAHQRTHTGEKPYRCSQCEKSYTLLDSLRKHQILHTGERPFRCSQCEKSFAFSGNLKAHQRFHTGEKPFHCSLCEKNYTHSSALKKHQLVHTGEKPHQCSQCEKRFPTLGQLKDHQKIHTGEKPYLCSYCGKSFYTSKDLKRHQRIHTGEKPYLCSQCGESFSRSRELKRHQVIHTGGRPSANPINSAVAVPFTLQDAT